VSDVLVRLELDVLAGRQAIRRAGRGEEYDPMTSELVKTAEADLRTGNKIPFEILFTIYLPYFLSGPILG
jgi:hypothetical protein